MKVAVVTDIPTPYRDPLWARFGEEPGIDLHVLYMTSGEKHLDWTPDWKMPSQYRILPGRTWIVRPESPLTFKWNPRLWPILDELRPDLLIVGSWGQPTSWVAMTWARAHGIPYALQCESHLLDPRPLWIRAIKQAVVRVAVTGQVAGLPTGSLAARCMTHYGAPPGSLHFFPNSPDAEALSAEAEELRPDREAIRAELGFAGPTVLFVGRLIPVKGVDVLLEAFAIVHAADPTSQLCIVGSGGEEPSLRRRIRELGLSSATLLPGFVAPSRLIRYYTAADLFCLPSRIEPWGAVVNEALACGLPAVTSDRVGASYDLLNANCGDLVPPEDPGALAQALRHWLAFIRDRPEEARNTSRRQALAWSHDRSLDSLRAVVRSASVA